MSKIKEAIKTAQTSVSKAAINTYGARIYDFEQVCKILEDLYDVANEDGAEQTLAGTITQSEIDELIEGIEQRIDGNINKMDDTDIVDEDSIEITLSGGRYTIDNIDANKDNIVSEASYGIDDVVNEWAYKNKIVIEASI
jgi:hypothetical protein